MTYIQITSNSSQLSAYFQRIARQLPEVLDEAVRVSAVEAQTMYQATVATWTHQPTFELQHERTGRWGIKTDSEIYGYVDKGTPGHYIPLSPKTNGYLVFRWPSTPKTKPGFIASYNGAPGPYWARKKQVWHKGIKPRRFSQIIAQRAQAPTANRLRNALKQATYGMGTGL